MARLKILLEAEDRYSGEFAKAKKEIAAFGKSASGIPDVEKKFAGIRESARSTSTELKSVTTVTQDTDRSLRSLFASSNKASGGLRSLAANLRATSTVAKGAVGIPALVAAIGGVAPVATAAAGATGQLAVVLGQALGGAATVAGTAIGGSVVGLKAYGAAIGRTISDSRAAYEATHELAMQHLENQRNTILNTKASEAFNQQINKSIIALTKTEAAIGSAAFPAFTREMGAWTKVVENFTPKIAKTSGALANIAAKFSQFVRTAHGGDLVGRVFDFISTSALKAAKVLNDLGRTGLTVFLQMIPAASRFQDLAVDVADNIREWAMSARGLSTVDNILAVLEKRFYQLSGAAVDVGKGIFGIFRGLSGGGAIDAMAKSIENGARAFANLMRQGGGARQAITQFMHNAQPALKALGGLALEVGKQFLILSNNVIKAGQSGGGIGTLAKVINAIKNSIAPLRKMFQDTFIALGPALADLIPDVAKFVSTFLGSSGPIIAFVQSLDRALEIFNGLPGPVKNAAVQLAGAYSVFKLLGGGALVNAATSITTIGVNMAQTAAIAGKSLNPLRLFSAGLRGVGLAARFMLGPWGLLITGVAAGTALIIKNWSKIRPAVQPVIKAFKQVWGSVKPLLSALGRALSQALGQVAKGFFSVVAPGLKFSKASKGIASVITGLARKAMPFLIKATRDVVGWLNKSGPTFQKVGKIVGTTIVRAFKVATTGIRGIVAVIRATVKAFGTIVGAVQKVVSGMIKGWNQARSTTQKVWNTIRNAISSAWNAIRGAVQKGINTAKSVVQSGWNAVKSATQSVWNAIKGALQSAWNAIRSTVQRAINTVKSAISRTWNQIKSTTSSVWNSIRSTVSSRITSAKNTVTKIVNGIRKTIQGVWKTVSKGTATTFENIFNTIDRWSSEAHRTVTEWWGKIEEFVNRVLNTLGLKGGGSDGSVSGRDTGGSGGGGGGGGRRDIPAGEMGRARGGVDYSPRRMAYGGFIEHPAGVAAIADGDFPRAIWGEAGPEAYIPLGRKTPEGMHALAVAARAHGFQLMQMARGGLLEGFKRAGTKFYQLGGTHYGFSAIMQKVVDDVESKYPTKANTYYGHPGGDANSADFWSPGGRGSPVGQSTGSAIANYLPRNWSPYDWLIWAGTYHTMSGSKPYWDASDMHYDHVHFTKTGSTSGFGWSPLQPSVKIMTKFEDLWADLVQPVVDRAVAAMRANPYWMGEGGALLTETSVDRIHQWIFGKVRDIVGGTGLGGADMTLQGEGAKGGGPGLNREIGRKMLAASPVEGSWSALDQLWTRESGWSRTAENPTSGAYGIPQAYPASKLPDAGLPPKSYAGPQIDWGLGYIKSTYNTTDAAWAHSQQYGWYARGGVRKGRRQKDKENEDKRRKEHRRERKQRREERREQKRARERARREERRERRLERRGERRRPDRSDEPRFLTGPPPTLGKLPTRPMLVTPAIARRTARAVYGVPGGRVAAPPTTQGVSVISPGGALPIYAPHAGRITGGAGSFLTGVMDGISFALEGAKRAGSGIFKAGESMAQVAGGAGSLVSWAFGKRSQAVPPGTLDPQHAWDYLGDLTTWRQNVRRQQRIHLRALEDWREEEREARQKEREEERAERLEERQQRELERRAREQQRREQRRARRQDKRSGKDKEKSKKDAKDKRDSRRERDEDGRKRERDDGGRDRRRRRSSRGRRFGGGFPWNIFRARGGLYKGGRSVGSVSALSRVRRGLPRVSIGSVSYSHRSGFSGSPLRMARGGVVRTSSYFSAPTSFSAPSYQSVSYGDSFYADSRVTNAQLAQLNHTAYRMEKLLARMPAAFKDGQNYNMENSYATRRAGERMMNRIGERHSRGGPKIARAR